MHWLSGGKWTGDYLVVDYEALQRNPNAGPGKCHVHRTSTIVNHDPANEIFPLQEF